jgi:CHAT domain-containing protein
MAAGAFEAAIGSAPFVEAQSVPLYQIELGRILLAAGALDEAWAELRQSEPRIPRVPSPTWYDLQAIKIEILLDQGKPEKAREVLNEVVASAPSGFLTAIAPILGRPVLDFLADPAMSFEQQVAAYDDDVAHHIPLLRLGSFARALLAAPKPLDDQHQAALFAVAQAAVATQVGKVLSLSAASSIGDNPAVRSLYSDLLRTMQRQQADRLKQWAKGTGIGGIPYDSARPFTVPCSAPFGQSWNDVAKTYLAQLHDIEKDMAAAPSLGDEANDIIRRMGAAGVNPGQFLDVVPLSVDDVRHSLAPGQAVIQYVLFPRYALAVVITQSKLCFHVIDVSRGSLTDLIKRVLASAASSAAKDFDIASDRRLSELLLGDAIGDLAGITHLIIIPSGSLESLPFGLLRDPSSADPTTEPPDVGWLIDRFPISILPGLNALVAMRASEIGSLKAARPNPPFVGFGAPTLGGANGCQTVLDKGLRIENGLADPDQLRQLCPVWSLEDDLIKLAAMFNGTSTIGPNVGDQATEILVKQMSAAGQLRGLSVLDFATHGNLATRPNGTRGYAPPGLVLTPPATASERDDGYLTTAEIAGLDLTNVDWVLLTACNTATSDGSPGAEALSGVTQAFMFAGARAALVSHWSVDKDAGSAMVVRAAANVKNGQSKATALQEATIWLKSKDGNTNHRRPYYWAPFSHVGL